MSDQSNPQGQQCDDADQLKAKGVSDVEASEMTARKADLQRAGVPWAKLLDLVGKYGPVVWQIVKELLDDNTFANRGTKAPPA